MKTPEQSLLSDFQETSKLEKSWLQAEKIIEKIAEGSRYHRQIEGGKEILVSPEGEKFSIERETDPESNAAQDIFDIMQEFDAEERESPESIREYLPNPKYFYHNLRNDEGELISHSQNTILDTETERGQKEGLIFYASIVTREKFRRRGLAKELHSMILKTTLEEVKKRQEGLLGAIGEARAGSEGFWNHVRLRRLYFEDSEGNLHEVPYICPPLEWDEKTGEPAEGAGSLPEHLMLMKIDGSQEITNRELISMVEAIYESDYTLHTEEEGVGPTEEAIRNCQRQVKEFRDQIEESLKTAKDGKIYLLSAQERQNKIEGLKKVGKKLFEIKTEDQEETSATPESNKDQKENLVTPETIGNARTALTEYLKLKPEERVLLIHDFQTSPEMLEIFRKAIKEFGGQSREFEFKEETKSEEIKEAVKDCPVIISMSVITNEAAEKLYDEYLEEFGSRLACLMDLSPEVFKNNGAMTENLEDMEYRMNKIEHALKDAVGFKIVSSYGTDLEVGLRPFKDRGWDRANGIIEKAGEWDNLPAGEVYTTPDESRVNGVLVLPALNSVMTKDQGVDEWVRVTVRDGKIISIEGGQSAEILKKNLEESTKEQIESSLDPGTVRQIAEIAFGANGKARGTVSDAEKSYSHPGTSFIEAEKSLHNMHLAFGSSQHGSEKASGFESAVSHYDFIIPYAGLTVEIFKTDKDFKNKKNGHKIISDGNIKFFE
jgi:leucyl aminopeptidase (aminopeptidase T)